MRRSKEALRMVAAFASLILFMVWVVYSFTQGLGHDEHEHCRDVPELCPPK